jgi:hypothetical protein
MIEMNENKLESKENFRSKIEKYYLDIAEDQIPVDLLNALVDKITDSQYDNYKRFWKQYPKSRKRYSELKIEDLEHPFVRYIIIDFFKIKTQSNYQKFSKTLLRMNDEEFRNYEISKYQYETK